MSCGVISGASINFIFSGTELMNCQKYLTISVLLDNLVSVMMILYYLYESTQSRDYVYLERAALNIVTAEQENLDTLMEGSFKKDKKKDFVYWNKDNQTLEEGLIVENHLIDEDNDGDFDLINVLIDRQETYLQLIKKKNVTETDADMEEWQNMEF